LPGEGDGFEQKKNDERFGQKHSGVMIAAYPHLTSV
jgi:hypothetical protein